uniref:mannose-6-phosphate isomerase n=4 Tax=sundaicus species complex TaxID=199889 RepID=A0A182PK16_9DIPT
MELVGSVKNYEWGKLGGDSFVAKLAQANSDQLEVRSDLPYAELWMGDHVSGPAMLKTDGRGLDEVIRADPTATIGSSEGQLPFLLKVLSIRKALSVQVHPNKIEAEKLHRQFPDIYKDPNHKPELAIALTDFEALCGFRPYEEIERMLHETAELGQLVGTDVLTKFQAKDASAVPDAYGRLMHSTPDAITQCIEGIAERMRTASSESSELRDLFLRLYADFGCDVGVLSIYFLNYLRLKPGQAIFLEANVPHAYLDGDCVECMACSDNVVRAGLTPKFKDVDTLLRLVRYDCKPGGSMLFQSKLPDVLEQPYTRIFAPPVPDFAVIEIRVPAGTREYSDTVPANGSILLTISGKGTLLETGGSDIALSMGKIVFLPSGERKVAQLKVTDTSESFLAFLAMRNDLK